MRNKKEKTEYGTVKAVMPRKKNVSYGEVVAPEVRPPEVALAIEGGEQEGEQTEVSGAPAGESASGESPMSSKEQALMDFLEAMENMEASLKDDEEEQSGEGEPESPAKKKPSDSGEKEKSDSGEPEEDKQDTDGDSDDSEKPEDKKEEEKSEEQKKEEQTKKEEENNLSKFLRLQLQIRALGEIFGAVKMTKEGEVYHSFVAVDDSKLFEITTTPPAPKIGCLLSIEIYPYFRTKDEAEAFVEVCKQILVEYTTLSYNLNAQAIAVKPIKVIHS